MMYVIITTLVALAALYAWVFFSQLHTPGFTWLQRWARRGWRAPLVSCPWCFGWWASLVLTVLAHLSAGILDWAFTPISAIASAALVGLLAGLTPGADLEDFDLE